MLFHLTLIYKLQFKIAACNCA